MPRNRGMKSPINSVKHYVQTSVFTVGLGAVSALEPALAVERTSANLSTEVVEGAKINTIYLEYWITSDDGTQGSFVMSVEKIPSSAPSMTYAQSIALHTYPNKKNILYTTQGLTPPNSVSGIPVVRQWISIPKGKERFGLGDRIRVNFSGITNGINVCGLSIYKEYF